MTETSFSSCEALRRTSFLCSAAPSAIEFHKLREFARRLGSWNFTDKQFSYRILRTSQPLCISCSACEWASDWEWQQFDVRQLSLMPFLSLAVRSPSVWVPWEVVKARRQQCGIRASERTTLKFIRKKCFLIDLNLYASVWKELFRCYSTRTDNRYEESNSSKFVQFYLAALSGGLAHLQMLAILSSPWMDRWTAPNPWDGLRSGSLALVQVLGIWNKGRMNKSSQWFFYLDLMISSIAE